MIKNNRLVIGLVVYCGIITNVIAAESAAESTVNEYAGYKLIWSDEFNKDGAPDPSSWVPEQGFVRNEELQFYQLKNATCKDGILTIEARKEKIPNPGFDPKGKSWQSKREFSTFTSASIKTAGKHAWTYGRFEMRARIPTAQGTWPAFWTLGSAREWPDCGEIDIMEYYKDTLMANIAWGSGKRWQPKWDSTKTPIKKLGNNWSESFHVWRLDWDEHMISISIDGQELNEAKVDNCKNPDGTNPFREPHYLLLNLAIGGNAAGAPGDTTFPQRFEIDWVRVYQKK